MHNVLDIQIEIKANNGWFVQYREGSKYFIHQISYSWQDAENFCIEKGGHLASVKNIADRKELDASEIIKLTWIVGTDRAIEDVWVWPDGSQLGGKN